jgi:tRNA(Ile)-lysidine synthase
MAVVHGARGVDLPGGVRADRIGGVVVLEKRAPGALGASAPPPFRYALAVPGRVRIAECGRELSAAVGWPEAMAGAAPRVALDAAPCSGGLWVRSWRPGDWLRPVGLGGRKKVQDVFVDRKVPRADRARVPLVVAADDRVIWVPGHAVDEGFRATAPTGDVVVLTVTELGGRE